MRSVLRIAALSVALLAGSLLSPHTLAQTASGTTPPRLDKAAVAQYLRYAEGFSSQVEISVDEPKRSMFPDLYQLQVHLKAGKNEAIRTYYVTANGKNILTGPVFDLQHSPFAAALSLLKEDGAPATGPANAPVTIYVFSDFQCPYCREEAKVLRERVEKDHPNDVRLVFKDFPLESIHPWARPAAIAGECLAQQNAGTFWKFHDWIYQHQEGVNPENLTAKVQEFVKTSPPVDENKLSACMASSATAAHVDSTIREGRELGVVQTPTMFVNGRMVSGALSAEQMDSLVRMEMQHRQETVSSKQQASNEKCCEVNIPTATHN